MAEDIDLDRLIMSNRLIKTVDHVIDPLSENTNRDHPIDLLNGMIEYTGQDRLIDPIGKMIEDIDQDCLIDLFSETILSIDLGHCADRLTVNDTDLGHLVENTRQIVIEEDRTLRITEGTLM